MFNDYELFQWIQLRQKEIEKKQEMHGNNMKV